MKPSGRHPVDALSAVQVRNIKEPGRYADGNGLYLIVDPSGARRWVLRTVVHGKRRDIGLGSTRLVSLAEARTKARDMRKLAREGGDPLAARRAEQAIPTFKATAETVHGIRADGWRNPKHAAQWLRTLETYAFPAIGNRRVDHVDTADLEAILRPIWLAKPETARRVRQRIGTVLDWATTAGHRTGANPATLVGPGLARQTDMKAQKHHEALPYEEAPALLAALRVAPPDIVRMALEWTLLTAARTGETTGATFDEVDVAEAVWNVPAERMKGGKPHRVPLPPRCVEIVQQVRELGATTFLFPGARFLASAWRWGRKRVNGYLSRLDTLEMIERKPEKWGRLGGQITICNYTKFQILGAGQGDSEGPVRGQSGAKLEEGKQGKRPSPPYSTDFESFWRTYRRARHARRHESLGGGPDSRCQAGERLPRGRRRAGPHHPAPGYRLMDAAPLEQEQRPPRKWCEGATGTAAVILGLSLVQGRYSRDDAELARQLLTSAFLEGIPDAGAYLGDLWSSGIGGEMSESVAAQLFAQAAEQGSAQAAWHLGLAYMAGRGVEQSAPMGYFWLSVASALPGAPPEAAIHRDAALEFLSPEQGKRVLLAAMRWRPSVPTSESLQ